MANLTQESCKKVNVKKRYNLKISISGEMLLRESGTVVIFGMALPFK